MFDEIFGCGDTWHSGRDVVTRGTLSYLKTPRFYLRFGSGFLTNYLDVVTRGTQDGM